MPVTAGTPACLSGTPDTSTILLEPLVVTADLVMLYTGDSFLSHGPVVPHPVFGKLSFFLDQDIQH